MLGAVKLLLCLVLPAVILQQELFNQNCSVYAATTFFVNTSGVNSADCGASSKPCYSISFAVVELSFKGSNDKYSRPFHMCNSLYCTWLFSYILQFMEFMEINTLHPSRATFKNSNQIFNHTKSYTNQSGSKINKVVQVLCRLDDAP